LAKQLVSLPDDLKQRMDAARDAGEAVVWSEVAREAFEAKLAELAIDGPLRLQAIAARLKATRDAKNREEAAIGRADGKAWASLSADIHDLGRLQALVDSDQWFPFWQIPDATPAERLYAVITGRPPDAERSAIFWADIRAIDPARAHITGNRTPWYLSNFVSEALLVWNQVRPLLETD